MHESPDQTPSNGNERVDEISQLRERLAFYESFDRLIQDNISRAGDLLREAAAKKSEGDLALRKNSAEFEKQQLTERMNYRKIFSGLLDEVTVVQQNVERLARQVADALDDLEAVIPAAGELTALESDSFPSMPSFAQGITGELNAGVENSSPASGYDEESGGGLIADPADIELGEPDLLESLEPVDEFVFPDEVVQDTTDFGTPAPPSAGLGSSSGFTELVQASVDRVSAEMGAVDREPEPGEHPVGISVNISAEDGSYEIDSLDHAPGEVAEIAVAEADTPESSGEQADGTPDIPGDESEDHSSETASEPAVSSPIEPDTAADEWIDDGPAAATTLLVHGVPRATTALSLKRYLEGLEQVHSVEPREYAEGVLRLQVASDLPIGISDLLGWPEAEGLEAVDVRDDFLEVRLGR